VLYLFKEKVSALDYKIENTVVVCVREREAERDQEREESKQAYISSSIICWFSLFAFERLYF
jgi:hypothetical protein